MKRLHKYTTYYVSSPNSDMFKAMWQKTKLKEDLHKIKMLAKHNPSGAERAFQEVFVSGLKQEKPSMTHKINELAAKLEDIVCGNITKPESASLASLAMNVNGMVTKGPINKVSQDKRFNRLVANLKMALDTCEVLREEVQKEIKY